MKGDRKTLGNFGGSCFLPMASRIIARVLATGIQTWSEKLHLIGDTQRSFRAGRSIADAAQIIVRIHEELRGNKSTNIPKTILLDIIKAYPRVKKTTLWAMLEKLVMKTPTLRLFKGLHDNTKHEIRGRNTNNIQLKPERCLRKRDATWPVFFNTYHAQAMNKLSDFRTSGFPNLKALLVFLGSGLLGAPCPQ